MAVWKDGTKVGVGGNPDFDSFSMGSLVGDADTPVLRLPFDGTYVDLGSGGKTLTATGSPKEVEELILPPGNQYTSFNGGQSLTLSPADTAAYHTDGDITILMAVRLHTVGSVYQTMFGFRDGPSTSNYQWWGFYGGTFHYWQSNSLLYSVSTVGRLKEWHVYAFVRESNVYRVYRDGVQIGADSATMTAPSSSVEGLCIGARPGGDSAYADLGGEILMYHRALSTSEISQKSQTLLPNQ